MYHPEFSHWAPWKVFSAQTKTRYEYYDADKMNLFDEGHIDWCNLQDCCNDEYRIMVEDEYVEGGLIEVDRPQREGRGMFIASHHSALFINSALPAANMGLWWHIQSRTPDLEKSLVEWTKRFAHRMSAATRDRLNQHIIDWRIMFPGDDRVEDFHTDFVLNMLTRRRTVETQFNGKTEVWFE